MLDGRDLETGDICVLFPPPSNIYTEVLECTETLQQCREECRVHISFDPGVRGVLV